MNDKWIKTNSRLPPQGLKVLCFTKGDMFVSQRFGEYWFPFPFLDSQYATNEPPEMWKNIDFPDGFKGKMHVMVGKEKLDMDEFSRREPEDFKILINHLIKSKHHKNGESS